VLNFVFMTKTVYNVEIRQECKDCHGDLVACDKERYSGPGRLFSKSMEQVSP